MTAASERALLVVALAASPVAADDIDSETYRSTPAIAGDTFHLAPADVGASGDWLAIAAFSYARNPLTIETSIGGMTLGSDRPVTMRAMAEVGGAYAFLDRFEAAVRVPMFQQSGESPDQSSFHIPAASGFAIGDASLYGRARLSRSSNATFGASLQLTLPTAKDRQFVSTTPTARLLGITTIRTAHVTITGNAGAVLRGTSTYRNSEDVPDGAVEITQGSGVALGLGASLHATSALQVTAELFGELTRAGEQGWNTPVDALAGLRYQLANGMLIGVAAGRGVTDGLGTPEARAVISFAFIPSRATATAPTIEEEEPEAPRVAGKSDAVASDARDRCPLEAEDFDGFEDNDGCADPDNDADAIIDAKDKCPDKAEVVNGVDDNDGCPDEAEGSATSTGGLTPMQAAEQTFRQGRDLMKQKKYDKACAAFEQSQRLDPQYGTQFNIAGCYAELGKLATAWTMYRELSRADTNTDRRQQALDAANKLAKRVPKLKLVASNKPKGLNVYMNGTDATPLLDIENPVDFGTYEIVAGAPGHTSWRKTITVHEAGKVINVKILLEAKK